MKYFPVHENTMKWNAMKFRFVCVSNRFWRNVVYARQILLQSRRADSLFFCFYFITNSVNKGFRVEKKTLWKGEKSKVVNDIAAIKIKTFLSQQICKQLFMKVVIRVNSSRRMQISTGFQRHASLRTTATRLRQNSRNSFDVNLLFSIGILTREVKRKYLVKFVLTPINDK